MVDDTCVFPNIETWDVDNRRLVTRSLFMKICLINENFF
jgi:hypothetical protein